MNIPTTIITLACLTTSLLAACTPQNPDETIRAEAEPVPVVQPAPAPVPEVCSTCGVVSAINVREQRGEATGVGVALGALVGGLAGNQVGGGSGKKIATVA